MRKEDFEKSIAKEKFGPAGTIGHFPSQVQDAIDFLWPHIEAATNAAERKGYLKGLRAMKEEMEAKR